MQVTANKHEFICNACGEKISSVHDIKTTAFVTGITDSKGKVQYYSIIIKDVCSVCRYSNTLDTSNHEHIASSYSYDKTTQILKFTCSTCGQQEYKCDDIYLDYEIKDNVDNSSDNSSSDVSSDTSSSNTDSNIPDNNSSDKKNKFSK